MVATRAPMEVVPIEEVAPIEVAPIRVEGAPIDTLVLAVAGVDLALIALLKPRGWSLRKA